MRVTFFLIWGCLVSAPTAIPATLTILPDGTGDYPTIQAAIDAAQNGDEIVLGSGVFGGDGNRNLSLRGKTLTLRSASDDPLDCTIDPAAGGGGSHRAFLFDSGEGPDAIVRGVTVQGGDAQDGGALAFTLGASPTIRNCVFQSNAGSRFGGAVYCQADCSPSFESCVFVDNHAGFFGGACYADVGATLTLLDCTLAGNSAGSGGGVFCRDADAVVTGCTFHANACDGAASGIYCDGTGDLTMERTLIVGGVVGEAVYCDDNFAAALTECDLYDNEGGDWIGPIGSQAGVSGNISDDPQFCQSDPLSQLDWALESDSPCLPAQAGVQIGAWDLGCDDTLVTPASWGQIKQRYARGE